jgi:hypothetical protein
VQYLFLYDRITCMEVSILVANKFTSLDIISESDN